MKKRDTALLIGGTVTGMALVTNLLALGCIREHFVRRVKEEKPGKIESVDEMHIDYLRRKNLAWIKKQYAERMQIRSRDGLNLRAEYIHNSEAVREENEPVNIVLLSHGYGGSGYKDMLIFTDFYRKQGFDMLLVDQRSHGKSDGSAITFGALEKGDIVLWIRELIDKYNGNCRIILHGWSMGAATCYLAAAQGLPSQVKGIVFDCGYGVAEAQFFHVAKNTIALPKTLLWYILQFMKPLCRILCGFDMKDSSPLFVSRSMKLPIFFVHGDADSCVPAWMGRRLYDATDRATYRDMLVVPKADHTYSYIYDKAGYEEGILRLFENCLN